MMDIATPNTVPEAPSVWNCRLRKGEDEERGGEEECADHHRGCNRATGNEPPGVTLR